MYYVYLLRCEDDTIYTGIAADVEKRMKTHFEGGPGESKYVRSHGAKKLELVYEVDNKNGALSLERRIKSLSRSDKERLINCGPGRVPLIERGKITGWDKAEEENGRG